MKDVFKIEEYFTDKEIIRLLCKKRALAAKKLHDGHFLRNISKDAKSPHNSSPKGIFILFPPRKEWIRLNLKERNIRNTNSIKQNAIQLERTICRERKRVIKGGNKPLWLIELDDFILEIQKDALDIIKNYQIPKPLVKPIIKDKAKLEYRPISSFKLKDLIIIGQYSRYLTNSFDQLFLNCSYAFRTGINNPKSFNHHSAIEDIIAYKNKHQNVYVAECDIKKFYDCVNHHIIRERFDEFVKRANEELNIKIDLRAINVFYSYLNCFSFNDDVAKKEKTLVGPKGKIPWVTPEELEQVGSNPITDKIGVPQGGALSCLIANLILDSVDRNVLKDTGEETFYARFCDDMVLMNPAKNKCLELFEIYQNSLVEVKLISHKPKSVFGYSKHFWAKDLKSKEPYSWNQSSLQSIYGSSISPWLSFVGYQIRYDGLLRIRKSSIEKELKKQVAETDKILTVLKKKNSANVNSLAIIFRLQQRLISMAVGRMQMNNKNLTMCWAAGFKIAKTNQNIKHQFKRLDRNREKQISRMVNFVAKINTTTKKDPKPDPPIPLPYYGSRYSYFQQFV
jgi:retron-type reverse transcriptase